MKKLVIFGASGDLAKRKLMPALSNIERLGAEVIAYARSPLKDTYHEELRKFHDYQSDFPETVRYIQGTYDNLEELRNIVDEDTIYYFSIPPELYYDLLKKLADLKFSVVGIEKPFGTSHESFLKLAGLGTDKTYFIDHYLLKPLIVAIPKILFDNQRLASLLNKRYIEYVEACFNEEMVAEGRAYYDKAGCIKDVIQSHLVVCLATVLTARHDAAPEQESSIRSKTIECMSIDDSRCIYGHYEGYADEFSHSTNTETFAILPLSVDNETWEGVPFVLIGGKGLHKKVTQISLTVRNAHISEFLGLLDDADQKEIQPSEIREMRLCFNIAPFSKVTLDIRLETTEKSYTMYSSQMIEEIMYDKYKDNRDHEIVFEKLFSKNSFCCCKMREVSALWRLFDKVLKQKKDLICYERDVELPAEAKSLVDSIKKTI